MICSVTTPADFKKVLHDWEMQVSQDSLQFKQLYLFTFNYVKSTTQKSMEVEVSGEGVRAFDSAVLKCMAVSTDGNCSLAHLVGTQIPHH